MCLLHTNEPQVAMGRATAEKTVRTHGSILKEIRKPQRGEYSKPSSKDV